MPVLRAAATEAPAIGSGSRSEMGVSYEEYDEVIAMRRMPRRNADWILEDKPGAGWRNLY